MIKMTKNRINDLEIENVYLKSELLDRPTMRDQFAMAALMRISGPTAEIIAKKAYSVADAMMKARDEPTKN